MASFKEVLNNAKSLTRKKAKETSATELLFLNFSDLKPNELYLKYEEEMPKESENKFENALELYLENNIPVQQIIGHVYFYGYKFSVKNTALIPRFETEELVANTLIQYDEYFSDKKVDVLDIGTGSGCLAITLALEEPLMKVTATDISEEALLLARENAKNLNAKVEFIQGDMLKPVLDKKFDILISNPPYIPNSEKVDSLIYDNEPHIALFGGEDGLDFYREIISNANKILKEKAIIAFEHAYDKKEELQILAKQYFPNAKTFTLKDMQNKDRMTFIIIGF
ncbi:MAG: peptide chain release factor N(5)-glutamine methyltransferase [Candidatus Izemoplasmatales bacterium]|jgi:release factor glutamine methyltransferase|nr:peptide chain release factor N(5)-glutamine methyltransferase [Candidatus Izemoplasmatales bacterium]